MSEMQQGRLLVDQVVDDGDEETPLEPISLYGFTVLLQNLRFGYGSAIAVIVFLVTFGLALVYVRTVGAGLLEEER